MANTSLTKTNTLVYFGLPSRYFGSHWYYATAEL